MKRLLPILLLWCVVARGANVSFTDLDPNQFHANAFGPQPRVTLFSLSPTNLDLVIGINMVGVTNGHQLVISATGGQGQATNSIDIGALTNVIILTNGIERLIAATTDTNVVNILLLFPHMDSLVVTNGVTNLLLQASGADVVWADANGMLTNVPGQAANVFYSGPANSGPAQPTFRAIVQKDLLGANVAFQDRVNTFSKDNYFAGLQATNGVTNLSLTASTVLKSDSNKAESSIANGAGALTNNGAGVFGWYNSFIDIVSARALTNSFATIAFAESLTNGYLGSASGVGTNITLKGTTHFDTLTSSNNFNIQSLNNGTVERLMSGGGVDLTFNDVGPVPWLSSTTPLRITGLTNTGGATFANGLTTIDESSGLIATPEIDATTAFIQDLWITNLSGTIPAVNLQPSAIVSAGVNTSVSSATNLGVINYTVNATGGSGTDLAINYAVGVSNLTVESPIFTNSHPLFSTNNLMLETTIDVHGTTNFLQQHWDTFFRKGLFGYSNNISSNASGLWMKARWATNAVAGQVVLYVTGGLTNEDAALNVKASEIWSTNGVAAGGGSPPALPELLDSFVDSDGVNLTNHTTDSSGANFNAQAWVNLAPDLKIIGNAVTNTDAPGGIAGAYVNHTMSVADYTASLDVTNKIGAAQTTEISVGIRFNGLTGDNRSAYFVSYFPDLDTCRLYKVVAGTPATVTQLGSDFTTVTRQNVTNISVSASGTTITAKVNTLGGATMTATDSAIAGAGVAGIGSTFRGSRDCSGWVLDNFKVTVP